jgi:heme A synthase
VSRPAARAAIAVLSAFFGVRRRQQAAIDSQLRPRHFVFAGVFLLLAFVGGIVVVVQLIV